MARKSKALAGDSVRVAGASVAVSADSADGCVLQVRDLAVAYDTKQAVEMAIETDEQTALDWLNRQD